MQRIALLTITLLFSFQSIAGSSCQRIWVHLNPASFNRTETFLLKTFKRKFERRILEECRQGCSEQQVQHIIFEQLKDYRDKLKGLRDISLQAVALISTLMVGSWAIDKLPEDLQFVGTIITYVGGIATFVIGTRMVEPLTSKIRHRIYGGSGHLGNSYLDNVWHQMQKTFGLNPQMARNLLNELIQTTSLRLAEVHRFTNEDKVDSAITSAANLALDLKHFFRELPVNPREVDPHLRRFFYQAFPKELIERPEFKRELMGRIFELERLVDNRFDQQEAQIYYDNLLLIWGIN